MSIAAPTGAPPSRGIPQLNFGSRAGFDAVYKKYYIYIYITTHRVTHILIESHRSKQHVEMAAVITTGPTGPTSSCLSKSVRDLTCDLRPLQILILIDISSFKDVDQHLKNIMWKTFLQHLTGVDVLSVKSGAPHRTIHT